MVWLAILLTSSQARVRQDMGIAPGIPYRSSGDWVGSSEQLGPNPTALGHPACRNDISCRSIQLPCPRTSKESGLPLGLPGDVQKAKYRSYPYPRRKRLE